MKKNNYLLTILFGLVLSSCCTDEPAFNVEESKTTIKKDMISVQGFNLQKDLSKKITTGLGGGNVTTSEFLDIIDTWLRYESEESRTTDVYVDMSGGVNYGYESTQEYIEEIALTLENDANYFEVGDELGPSSLTDFRDAYVYYSDVRNFNNVNSRLSLALEKCVNQNDRVSIFITDFLLDNGKDEKVRPLKMYSNINYPITENGIPWAIEEFGDYFSKNNILEIVAVEYDHPSGTYGCPGPSKNCSKYLYYMFFTPRHLVGTNSAVNDIIKSMKKFDRTKYIKIDPLSFGFEKNEITGVGDVDDYKYESVAMQQPKTYDNFKVEFIPFNINMFRAFLNDESGIEIFEDVKIIDNLTLKDRKNLDFCPYSLEVEATFYDVTDFFYQINSINKDRLPEYGMSFDANDYPGNLIDENQNPLSSPRSIQEKDLFSFDNENYSVTLNKLALNNSAYFGGEMNHGKLYLCDIEISSTQFDDYNNDFLKWTFYNRDGYLENYGLIGSINRALKQNKIKYNNKILYSYLIALNDNKN